MQNNIYNYHDYKDYLKAMIEVAEPKHGYISQLAVAAQCQRSYLSQVINSHVQLTPDHGLGLCRFFRLTEKETDYFLLLLEHARAGSLQLRERVQSKIDKLRKESINLSKRVGAQTIEEGQILGRYYSSWHWMAIHIISSIPEYQDVKSIARSLSIPEELVKNTLEKLMQMGCVEKKKDKWHHKGADMHLTNDSPSVNLHHNNWRQRSLLDSAMLNEESVHYTSVFSMSEHDYTLLRDMILKWIDDSRKVISPSNPEKLVCLCLDFFKV
jgi:uncharacterized protein (TIGR02147 family)